MLFSERLCKHFQRQQQYRLWFLILMTVGKFITLFSGFLSTCMPGFHKVWHIFEISTVKKTPTLHKGLLDLPIEMSSVHCAQFSQSLKLLYYFQRVLENTWVFFQLRFFTQAQFMVGRLGTFTLVINLEMQIFKQLMLLRLPTWKSGNIFLNFWLENSSLRLFKDRWSTIWSCRWACKNVSSKILYGITYDVRIQHYFFALM